MILFVWILWLFGRIGTIFVFCIHQWRLGRWVGYAYVWVCFCLPMRLDLNNTNIHMHMYVVLTFRFIYGYEMQNVIFYWNYESLKFSIFFFCIKSKSFLKCRFLKYLHVCLLIHKYGWMSEWSPKFTHHCSPIYLFICTICMYIWMYMTQLCSSEFWFDWYFNWKFVLCFGDFRLHFLVNTLSILREYFLELVNSWKYSYLFMRIYFRFDSDFIKY